MSRRYLPRSAWNARPRRHPPGRLDPADVRGIAFHWPGVRSSRPVSKRAVPRALRSWQDFHMDGHGWSDIAYNVAVDQWGRVWTLRGLGNRSAANGGWTVNSRYAAVLLVLVRGEQPSPAMLRATRRVVRDFRRRYPRGRDLTGHGAIRPGGGTECPGPAVRAGLRSDAFEPNRKEVIDVTEHQLRKIIRQEINHAHWGALWRTEQLVRALVRRTGSGPASVLGPARKRRRKAQK